MYDTIIIGAGLSGLAAGIRLAYYDQKVCILERHTTIGGLNSFYRLRGRNYDVGLHAVTNFSPRGAKQGPLARLLRQLRIRWEDFALSPQVGSSICFPGVTLRFTNEFEFFRSEVHQAFPSQRDRFDRLVGRLLNYDEIETSPPASARAILSESLSDPLLVEMLLCPTMQYGNPQQGDMDFAQFSILFRSIFQEGLARPFTGVRLILKHLTRKFKSLGGDLKLRSGVAQIHVDGDQAVGVKLDDGREIAARRILSSAGHVETLRMLDQPGTSQTGTSQTGTSQTSTIAMPKAGRMTFVEAIAILDVSPQSLGHHETAVFFNTEEQFDYRCPDALADVRTGMICSPNNFRYSEGELPEGIMRVTALANYDRWQALPQQQYQLEKLRWFDRMTAAAARHVPDFRRHIIETDMFTPTTVRRFTWHDNGAIYGAPQKQWDGKTHLRNLFLCGTDQGLLGIVGAMTSGITMANRHCLRDF